MGGAGAPVRSSDRSNGRGRTGRCAPTTVNATTVCLAQQAKS
jgi:hypothetical protein